MNKVPLRQAFDHFPTRIDWFPGHMRKAMRLLEKHHLKKIDVFIEVRDSRIPKTSENPELLEILPENMKRLVVYNKIDLVPQRKATELIK